MATHAQIAEAQQAAEEPVDTSDPAAVNRARKKASRLTRERLDVVGAVMEQKAGRAWMYGLLERCHIWQPSFQAGDQSITAFREGERNVGLQILGEIMLAAPTLYVTMVTEGKAA